MQIYSVANDKKEYDVFKGLLSGNQINTLAHTITLDCVKSKTLEDLGDAIDVYVLHDPCDIRKPNSEELEHLGQVMSLKKQVVNGYKTMNSVAVDPCKQEIHLIGHELYSTKMPNYVKKETLDLLPEASDQIKKLVAEGSHINTSILYQRQIKECSELLKKAHPNRKVCHISDREFDDELQFEYIDSLGDTFVSRMKLSRLSGEEKTCYTSKGKVSKKIAYKKLVDKKFANQGFYEIPVLTIKGKTYEKVTCKLEWEPLQLNKKMYNVVRISLLQGNREIFEHPMLLITNRSVTNVHEAKEIYRAYILRFKIEVVFRFLKQNLGWESFQVRDFNSIRNLLSLAFFLVGYFKELEKELKEHPLAKQLCQLALSKGKITIFFLLKGIEKLASFQEVSQWMQDNSITIEQVNELVEYLKNSKT